MKTYQSGTNEKKKNFFVRHLHAFIIAFSVLVVAAVVTIAIVFSLPASEPVDNEPVTPPVVTEPQKAVMPMQNVGEGGLMYAEDKLVYWETLETWKYHPGIDFVGDGDVVAILDGTVKNVEKTTLEGTVVTIEHADGLVSIYKSLDAEVAVKAGDAVKAGAKIGKAGTCMSELLTGNHLHLEIKKDGKHVDPETVISGISQDK